jgi:hypothetical protein
MSSIAAASSPASASPRIVRVACRALQVAAIVSAAGIVFLVGMFAAFAVKSSSTAMVLGTVNDALVVIQYVLLLPAVLAFRRVAADGGSPRVGGIIAALGVIGIAGVAILQGLLVAGRLTFEEEIGPVGIAYVPLVAWFIGTGWQAARAGVDRRGVAFGVVGASYLGFPIWAWRRARRLATVPMIPEARTAG